MKNFGSILTFIAISASVVSARALPASGDSIEARVPYPVVDEIIARSPKKNKAAANATADAAVAATSATAGKKAKGAKGAAAAAGNATAADAAGAAGNATAVDAAGAAGNATGAATGKKAKGTATAGAANQAAASQKGAQAATNNNAAQAQGGDLNSIVQGLTGINLGSLGLRSLPILETRKGKKNATATVRQNICIS
jgi:hypothetical protein